MAKNGKVFTSFCTLDAGALEEIEQHAGQFYDMEVAVAAIKLFRERDINLH